MESAWLWATRGTCARLQVGCVIADEVGHVLATGYNGAPRGADHCTHPARTDGGCQVAVHAESNAVLDAGRRGQPLVGAHGYVTHSPCWDCAKQMVVAGLRSVTYAVEYRNRAGRDYLATHGVKIIKYGYGEATGG